MNLNDEYEKLYELYNWFGAKDSDYDVFYATDTPVPYKNLKFYPVKTLYYQYFHTFAYFSFFVNKYDSKVAKCMGMNPLQFLNYEGEVSTIDGDKIPNVALCCLPCLEKLLLMCLRLPDTLEDGSSTIQFIQKDNKYYIDINGNRYNWQDFEKIRTIICTQNCIELPDWKIHPDIRKKLAEKDRLLAQVNERKVGSYEELIDSLMLAGGYSLDYILNLSIRRFTRLLVRYDIMEKYELMTILMPNMKEKERDKIVPWNGQVPKKDSYFDKVTSLGEIERKLGNQPNSGNVSRVSKVGTTTDTVNNK